MCRPTDGSIFTPQKRRQFLQHTVKLTYYFLAQDKILSHNTHLTVQQVARDALALLKVTTAEEFKNVLIADGAVEEPNWGTPLPNYMPVLDANKRRLDPEFETFLNSVFELTN